MLASGNHINGLDSYSNEAVEVLRGWQRFHTVGLAIIDPNRPSRDIPFIIPSKQAGRPDAPCLIRARSLIYRIGIRIPKEIIWANPNPTGVNYLNDAGVSQVQVTRPGGSDLLKVVTNPNSSGGALPQIYDTSEIHQVVPGSRYGYTQIKKGEGAIGGTQSVLSYIINTAIVFTPAREMAIDALPITFPNLSEQLFLRVDNGVAAPTTSTGKKSAFILEIAGYLPNLEVIEPEKAFYGVDALN